MKNILPLMFVLFCTTLNTARVTAETADATADFIARLQRITQLQGDFEQQLFSADGTTLSRSSGTFRLLKPGYFAWDITAPDSQLIVADPEFIWHFDRDLETVTRRPVTSSAQVSPLQVLGGDESVLREQFRIDRPAAQEFRLTAIAGDPGFRELTVRFEGQDITGMDILDRLDQRVEITLERVDSQGVLTASDFAFTPPPGADLFYYDE